MTARAGAAIVSPLPPPLYKHHPDGRFPALSKDRCRHAVCVPLVHCFQLLFFLDLVRNFGDYRISLLVAVRAQIRSADRRL